MTEAREAQRPQHPPPGGQDTRVPQPLINRQQDGHGTAIRTAAALRQLSGRRGKRGRTHTLTRRPRHVKTGQRPGRGYGPRTPSPMPREPISISRSTTDVTDSFFERRLRRNYRRVRVSLENRRLKKKKTRGTDENRTFDGRG